MYLVYANTVCIERYRQTINIANIMNSLRRNTFSFYSSLYTHIANDS